MFKFQYLEQIEAAEKSLESIEVRAVYDQVAQGIQVGLGRGGVIHHASTL
ncbi:MAG: hypothetical protein WCL71_09680 [Deltaproteobacteria bacterium]